MKRACSLALAALLAACGSASPGGPLDAGSYDLQRGPDLVPGPVDLAIPLRAPTEHPDVPLISWGGGPTLKHPTLVTAVWAGDPLADQRAAFAVWLAGSTYLDKMSEYGGGRGYADGPRVIRSAPPARLDDSAVGPLLRARIAAGDLPAPHADQIYLLYLPASTTSTLQGMEGCRAYGGYHAAAPTGLSSPAQMVYAIIPACGGSYDQETVTVSHEVVEAMSDPFEGRGYRDPDLPYGEIGDLCTGLSATFDVAGDGGTSTYVVSRYYSGRNAADGTVDPCVPVPAAPYHYFNAGLSPLVLGLSLDSTNHASDVLQIQPFSFDPSINKVSWQLWMSGIPGVTASPTRGAGAPGSTQEVTIKAGPLSVPGTYPIWVSSSAKGYQNVIYGALVVQ